MDEACWESYGFAPVGTERHTPVVDCLDGADGAVDEWRVTVAVAGVEQHPVADLVVAIGCPSGTGDRGPAEGAGVGEPAADAIGEVLGLRVRHDQCDRGLGPEGKDVTGHRVGHRPPGVLRGGGGVLPAVVAAQLL